MDNLMKRKVRKGLHRDSWCKGTCCKNRSDSVYGRVPSAVISILDHSRNPSEYVTVALLLFHCTFSTISLLLQIREKFAKRHSVFTAHFHINEDIRRRIYTFHYITESTDYYCYIQVFAIEKQSGLKGDG